jgi:large subunit ribosomal protein L4
MPRIKKPVTEKKSKLHTKKRAVAAVKKEKPMEKSQKKESPGKSERFSKVSLPILSVKGEKTGVISVPKDLFGAPYNTQLVSQAVRVFRMNQREGSAGTKTRGMVEGSTRKIYRQKGTGRARHGGIRAPIFVGGGIIFGPQPREFHKTLPKQMKKKALASVLSRAVAKGTVKIVDGLLELPMKTKSFAEMLNNLRVSQRILFIYGEETKSVVRALRNMKNVSVTPFYSLNTFDVTTHAYIVFTKDGLGSFIAKNTS